MDLNESQTGFVLKVNGEEPSLAFSSFFVRIPRKETEGKKAREAE